jgi:hypothetical protein
MSCTAPGRASTTTAQAYVREEREQRRVGRVGSGVVGGGELGLLRGGGALGRLGVQRHEDLVAGLEVRRVDRDVERHERRVSLVRVS